MRGKGKPKGWITRNGVHIPIYENYTADRNEPKARIRKSTKFSEEKYKHINPGYKSDSTEKFDPNRWNCVRCAIAFEANMRGDDVEAYPHKFGELEDGAKTHENAIAKAFGKHHDEWDVGAPKRKLAVKRISDMMEDFGPNSRAILFLAHKDGKHVVNVLANNGNPIIVDAQAGKHGSVKDMLKHYVTKQASIIRVDDSNIPDEWKKWAYKKRRK